MNAHRSSSQGFGLIEAMVAAGIGLVLALIFTTIIANLLQSNAELKQKIDLLNLKNSLTSNLVAGPLCTCLFKGQEFDPAATTSDSQTQLAFPGGSLKVYPNTKCRAEDATILAAVGSSAEASDLISANPDLAQLKEIHLSNWKDTSAANDGSEWVADILFVPESTQGRLALRPFELKSVGVFTVPGASGRKIESCGWGPPDQSADPTSIFNVVECPPDSVCLGNYKVRISDRSTYDNSILTHVSATATPGKFLVGVRSMQGRTSMFEADVTGPDLKIIAKPGYAPRLCYNHQKALDGGEWCVGLKALSLSDVPNCSNDLYFEMTDNSSGIVKAYNTGACDETTQVGPDCWGNVSYSWYRPDRRGESGEIRISDTTVGICPL